MNNHEKFTTRLSKLKLHRANSQTISSYPVRFSTDVLFSSVFLLFCLFFAVFFLIKKIYILIHFWLCGWASEKHFHHDNFRKKDYFFWSNSEKLECSCPNCPIVKWCRAWSWKSRCACYDEKEDTRKWHLTVSWKWNAQIEWSEDGCEYLHIV